MAFHRGGDLRQAEELYALVLAREPDNFDARHGLGVIRSRQGRTAEALGLIGSALQARPDMPEALSNYANALRAAKRPQEALIHYDRALKIRPDFAEGWFNRGNVLRDMARPQDALVSYDRALTLAPGLGPGWNNRGNALRDLKRFKEALASYEKALTLRPDHVEWLNNRILALSDLGRFDDALTSCERALVLKPDFAEAWNSRGNILARLQRPGEALGSFEKAVAANPAHPHAPSSLAQAALALCDWTRTASLSDLLKTHVLTGQSVVQPFTLLGYWDDPELQRRCAANYLRHVVPIMPPPLWSGGRRAHNKIRVAYLSADFRNSAAAYLTAELFEHHDRSRFEVTAFSFGRDDGSAMRSRLIRAFDTFHDVRGQGDYDAARLLCDLEADIAVDLMGYTTDARPGILAHRPCPVQVSWLGYPATMAANFIDYVIADKIVLPEAFEPFFTEKVAWMPHSYYPSDSTNRISERTPTRGDAGLPQDGFIFCCFNNSWKIAAPMFDIWMRLLAKAPGSVVWLLAADNEAHANLRQRAAECGIDPERLVFADRMDSEHHLARHRLADLFLDTLPYNAHTTASDALWAGLPVITCMGRGFAARVAASLLRAIGVPELVTENLQDYEALALKLATDPSLLASVREKIARNHLTMPLFDSETFRKDLEGAYTTMWDIAQAGDSPRSFEVRSR
jgi:predicted O-linked N-acetylglucosamine transferase (SPINDLY family)